MSYGHICNRDDAIVSSFHLPANHEMLYSCIYCSVCTVFKYGFLHMNNSSSNSIWCESSLALKMVPCGTPGTVPLKGEVLWVYQKGGCGINNISPIPPSPCWWHYTQPTPLKIVWMPYFTEELRENMLNYRLNLTFCNSQFPTTQMIFPKNTSL